MSIYTRLAISALLLLAVGATLVWLPQAQGGQAQSAGPLVISMTDAPDPVEAGGMVKYTITVENTSTEEQPSVIVEDSLDGPGAIQSATSSQGACSEPTLEGLTIACNLGDMPAGAIATISVQKQALSASVGGLSVDLNPARAALETGATQKSSAALLAAVVASVVALSTVILGSAAWYVRRRKL